MPLPLELVIPLPHDMPLARGVHATSPPHGRRVTINMTVAEYDTILAALSAMETSMTISAFVRQVAHNAAKVVLLHCEEERANERALDEQFLRDHAGPSEEG